MLDGATHVPAIINEDVACVACRYNLRGLLAGGRCPECGESIAYSLARRAARRIPNPIREADRRWIGLLIEGAMSALVAMLVRLAAVLVPSTTRAWTNRTRAGVVVGLAVALGVEAFACWRFTSQEIGTPLRRPSRVRTAARITSLVYFAVYLLPDALPNWVVVPVAIVAVFSGLAASLLIYVRLAQIGGRIRPFLSWQAALLAVLSPLWFVAAVLPQLDAGVDSLSVMLRAPTLLAGSADNLWQARHSAGEGRALIPLVLPLWAILFQFQLLGGLLWARHKQLSGHATS